MKNILSKRDIKEIRNTHFYKIAYYEKKSIPIDGSGNKIFFPNLEKLQEMALKSLSEKGFQIKSILLARFLNFFPLNVFFSNGFYNVLIFCFLNSILHCYKNNSKYKYNRNQNWYHWKLITCSIDICCNRID